MITVGVVGYGTIGKRVADAVATQRDMTVIGVAKTSPNFEAETAVVKGYDLYAAIDERRELFDKAGLPVAGNLDDIVSEADVIVDATPSGVGVQNRDVYEEHDTPAIYQGGEDADVAETSFNARANFEDAVGADHVRVVSCNTTGLSRLLAPLQEEYGVEKARVTLVRRGGDPGQTGRGPIDDILPDPVSLPSHHGPDVKTIFPDLAIDTLGLKVPATLMHMHSVNVTLESDVDAEAVKQLLSEESRLFLVPESAGIDGAGKLKQYALDSGRSRGDIWENSIWAESIAMRGNDLYLFQAIHQESDVVPENVDAIRAVTDTAGNAESIATTNETLGMGLGRTR